MRFWMIVLAFLAGCASGDPVSAPVPSDFLPLKTGAWFIYSVDSITTDQNIPTIYSYDLKIQVVDSFPNATGSYTYLLQRYKRTGTAPWSPLNGWSARSNNYEAVVQEGNISFIKISSPVQNGKFWNGNELNSIEGNEKCSSSGKQTCDLYTISDMNVPYENEWLSFDKSLTVIQHDDPDPIDFHDVRSEVYARGVGLVFRNIEQLSYCSVPACLGQQFVDKGLQYHQTLKEYGGL